MARALADQLDAMAATLQASGALDAATVAILAAPLARLTRIIIPHAHQKLDEIVYAADHALTVSAKPHGHDLEDAGAHVELKVSVCPMSSARRRCHFNWPIPVGVTDAERRAKLVASVRDKTRGGYAVLQVRDGLQRVTHEYRLSEAFLVGYFERVPLGKCANHNMGATECRVCKQFHRLLALHEASRDGVTDWTFLQKPVPSQCAQH